MLALWRDDTGIDGYWRRKANDTAITEYYDAIAQGHTFRCRIMTQDLDNGYATLRKGITHIAWVMEPVGKWEVDLFVVPDTGYLETLLPVDQAADSDLETGLQGIETTYYDITPAMPKDAFTVQQDDTVQSGWCRFGINHEPITGLSSIQTWNAPAAGTVSTVEGIAQPAGFRIRALEYATEMGKTAHGITHVS
jgi:hypothetical protein